MVPNKPIAAMIIGVMTMLNRARNLCLKRIKTKESHSEAFTVTLDILLSRISHRDAYRCRDDCRDYVGVFVERILFSDWTILIGNSSDTLSEDFPNARDFAQKSKANTYEGWVRSIEKVM